MTKRILEPEVMFSKDEVAAYDRLTRKYLRILHTGFIETILNNSPAHGKFLDVGTGSGHIAIGVAKYNHQADVYGIDLSETMLEQARLNAVNDGVKDRISFFLSDAKILPFKNETFDSVFSHNMLHHLPDPMSMIKEILRVVKKDGAIFIRDLKRISFPWIEFHVRILGLPYDRLMKKEYRDSIKAALSAKEWKEIFKSLNIPGAKLQNFFITHIGIERTAQNKRKEPLIIPTPLFTGILKKLYVS